MGMMKKILFALFISILLFVGLLFLWQHKKDRNKLLHTVEVTVTKGDVIQSVEATGVIKPSVGAEVKIGARVTGMVTNEPIKVGDFVKKGTIIAKIDDLELQKALEIAQEELQKILDTYPKEIERLQKEVEKAKLSVKNAKLVLDAAKADAKTANWLCKNKKQLRKRKSISEKEYKTVCTEAYRKQKNYEEALNALQQAKLNAQAAQLALEKMQKSFIHDSAIAKAKMEQAKIRLSYATIKAPFDGIITYISTQKGETVVAGLNAPQFAKILDPNRLENRIYIDETVIAKIKKGMHVLFHVDSFGKKDFQGKIDQIYPQPEIQNGVVYYVGVVKSFNDASLLRPEMTTHNKIIVQIIKNVLRLPNQAVKFKNGHFFVYLKKDSKVVEQSVQPGISDEHYTQILSGLKEGDIVLMESKSAH